MSRRSTIFAPRHALATRVAGPLFCVLILFYLGFHMLTGERGVFALVNANRQLAEINERLDNTRTKRLALENKVTLLSNRSLDLDMLDERARTVLGYTGKNERIIFLDDNTQ